MANTFPGDPYADKVDAFPIWSTLPKSCMYTVWTELHRCERSRMDMIRRLKKVDPKSWLAISRERACVGMNLELWMPVVRMLALECAEEEIRDYCKLPISAGEKDAVEKAKQILYDAVSGNLDIDDDQRVKAAQIILRMGVGKTTDNTINIITGVSREVLSPIPGDTVDGVCEQPADGNTGYSGEAGTGGIAGLDG